MLSEGRHLCTWQIDAAYQKYGRSYSLKFDSNMLFSARLASAWSWLLKTWVIKLPEVIGSKIRHVSPDCHTYPITLKNTQLHTQIVVALFPQVNLISHFGLCKAIMLVTMPYQVTCGDGQPSTVQESLTAIPSQTTWARRGMEKSGDFMLKSSRNFRCLESFLSAWGWRWNFDQSPSLWESQTDRKMLDEGRMLGEKYRSQRTMGNGIIW